MKRIILCLAFIACSLSQDTSEGSPPEQPPPEVICPMFSPPKLPDGCHLETTKNEDDCPIPKVVCPSCDLIECEEHQQCRMIDGNAKCFATPCPLAMPGRPRPGCFIENEMDENGCPRPRVVCNGTENEDCVGENMELKQCGSPCPETCEQIVTGVYPRCPRTCVRNACQCKQGYALDKDGKCVERDTCKESASPDNQSALACKENEEMKECGTRCPITCEMVVTGINPICPAICELNVCQCKEGYALDKDSKCVELEACKASASPDTQSATECKENEEMKECGSMCPITCEMVVTGNYPPCPAMCKLNVCECKNGYAYDDQQRCVEVNECHNLAGQSSNSTEEVSTNDGA